MTVAKFRCPLSCLAIFLILTVKEMERRRLCRAGGSRRSSALSEVHCNSISSMGLLRYNNTGFKECYTSSWTLDPGTCAGLVPGPRNCVVHSLKRAQCVHVKTMSLPGKTGVLHENICACLRGHNARQTLCQSILKTSHKRGRPERFRCFVVLDVDAFSSE